jgi:hypothetical protein
MQNDGSSISTRVGFNILVKIFGVISRLGIVVNIKTLTTHSYGNPNPLPNHEIISQIARRP